MPSASAANSSTFKVTTLSDCQIHFTRLFTAPRQVVFEAMTKPEHIVHWWGILGDGYSVPVCEVDLRPGGKWRHVGRAPAGDVEFYGVYREVVAPERLVFTEIFAPFPNVESVVTAVFTEEGGKTRLNMVAEYPSKEVRDMILGTGMEKGAAISYDRLDEVAMRLAAQNR